MKTIEILEAANKYYSALSYYYDADGDFIPDQTGDGLAEFIVLELIDSADDIDSAVRLLETAKRDLDLAIQGLEEKGGEDGSD